jgi:hypothetical protein
MDYRLALVSFSTWEHVKRHLIDNVPVESTIAGIVDTANPYNPIKEIQSKCKDQEYCYVNLKTSGSDVLTTALRLGIDYKTECLTMDIPPVVLVVDSKQCKLIHLLVALLSSQTTTSIWDVEQFLSLVMKQTTSYGVS